MSGTGQTSPSPGPGPGARVRRVGHKGAGLIAPGNTVAAFEAGRAAGVDMIEFDVVPTPPPDTMSVEEAEVAGRAGRWADSPLVLAHDWEDARSRTPLSLAEGLDHLASPEYADLTFNVDLKLPGYESRVLAALRERDLLGRVLVSSQLRESLARVRAEAPDVRVGWSVPRVRHDPFRHRATIPLVLAVIQFARLAFPARAAAVLRAGACDAIMAQWRLVTPRLVRAVREAGGELYVWTVDDAALIRRLEAMGVDAVISNDPRLFAPLEPV